MPLEHRDVVPGAAEQGRVGLADRAVADLDHVIQDIVLRHRSPALTLANEFVVRNEAMFSQNAAQSRVFVGWDEREGLIGGYGPVQAVA